MKKWLILGFLLCLIGLLALGALFLFQRSNNDNHIYVYYFNPSAGRLEAEARPLPEGDNQIKRVVRYLRLGPQSGQLVSTWPGELAPEPEDLLQAVILEESALLVFFSTVFNEIPPLNRSLFKAAFIYTMESLPFVSDIKILVTDNYEYAYDILMLSLTAEEGEYVPYVPWLIYDGSPGVYNDPFVSPTFVTSHTFSNLYFVDASGAGLFVAEYDAIEVIRQREQEARYALELLITRPRLEGALTVIPPETRVREIEFDGSDIYVDLSSDFMTRFTTGNTELAKLMIYSIVNTLIAETVATRVFFLIDAQIVENFHGIEDFHLAFMRNDTLLLSYDPVYEYEPGDDAEEDE